MLVRFSRSLLVLVLAAGALAVPAAQAQSDLGSSMVLPKNPCNFAPKVTKLFAISAVCMPVSGSFYNSATSETVNFSATLWIAASLANYAPGEPVRPVNEITLATLLPASIIATGATSGMSYTANGTTLRQALTRFQPGEPYRISHLEFTLIPTEPVMPGEPILPASSIFISTGLSFNSNGTLYAAGSTVLLEGDQLIPPPPLVR
jgi:hypothetical protein